jgi:mitochondrial fission protein ELM1
MPQPITKPIAKPTIWTVTDGKIGMVNQTLGLAEAIAAETGGAVIENKTVRPRAPWSWLPAALWPPGVTGTGPDSDPLAPPWPDIVISCGRHAVGPTLAIKRNSGGASFAVHVQHPHVPLARYDMIAAPRHDRLEGENVVAITGAIHRVTEAVLAREKAAFAATLDGLPQPRIAVLIGGANRSYRLTPAVMDKFAAELQLLSARASLMITASRRTGEEEQARLREATRSPNTVFWDGTGPNPYFAYLAYADAVIVTCDSVNMISEAAATGKPIHIVALEGGDRKFTAFHEQLYGAGIARPFTGLIEEWTYPPLDETKRAAEAVLRRMAAAKY